MSSSYKEELMALAVANTAVNSLKAILELFSIKREGMDQHRKDWQLYDVTTDHHCCVFLHHTFLTTVSQDYIKCAARLYPS